MELRNSYFPMEKKKHYFLMEYSKELIQKKSNILNIPMEVLKYFILMVEKKDNQQIIQIANIPNNELLLI